MCNIYYRNIIFTYYKLNTNNKENMAKVKGGTDGSISGMIGPVVFYKMRGKSYARQAPKERKKNSWSDDQVAYRKKVSRHGEFWRHSVAETVKNIFGFAAEEMTGYNLFLKTNLPAFSQDGAVIDLEWLHLSAGKLPLPHKLKAERSAGDPSIVEVSWQNDSGSGLASGKDELKMIVALEGKFTGPVSTGALRKDGTAVISIPEGPGAVQGIYLSFASAERKLYSPDQYFGL